MLSPRPTEGSDLDGDDERRNGEDDTGYCSEDVNMSETDDSDSDSDMDDERNCQESKDCNGGDVEPEEEVDKLADDSGDDAIVCNH